jgi:hypothetical protein
MSEAQAPSNKMSENLTSLAVQTLANTLGTLITGILLGGIAVRVGLIDVNGDSANQVLLVLLGLAVVVTPLAIAYILMMTWILNRIEPARRVDRNAKALLILQGLALAGLASWTLAFLLAMVISPDPDLWIIWPPITAAFIGAVLVIRTTARVHRNNRDA